MEKIIEDLNWRYAVKAFDDSKKVSSEDLDTIIEAFRLTASSFGLQPWKLVVVQDQAVKDSLVEHSWGQGQIANCSDLLVLARKNDFSDENIDEYIASTMETTWASQEDLQWYEDMMKGFLGRMDEDKKQVWVNKQIYIALGNLMTVCANMRIDSCPVEGFIGPKYDEILGLTEKGLGSVVVLPIGYRAEDDKYASNKKVRFATDEVVVKI